MSALFETVRNRQLVRQLGTLLGGRYQAKPVERTGTVLSAQAVAVSGQRYEFANSAAVPAGASLAVVNVQRPAAAIYAAPDSGGMVFVAGTGGNASLVNETTIINNPLTVHAIEGEYHTSTVFAWPVVGDHILARIINGLFAGRFIGPHAGLFVRVSGDGVSDSYMLEVTDGAGVPLLSAGCVDGGDPWVRIGRSGYRQLVYNPVTRHMEFPWAGLTGARTSLHKELV